MSTSHYSILYRGPLVSCNYGCEYCPFAKRSQTHAELEDDRAALQRFVEWCQRRGGHDDVELSVLFTPWGEALIRPWYQQAIARLSRLPYVRRVAIQTNISCHLKWLDECDLSRVALWCTYHPTEVTRERFLERCRELDARGVRYSVGIVGLLEHQADAAWLRQHLAAGVYLWVNAYKRVDAYYDPAARDFFTAIDPLFPINDVRHPSRGRDCRAGDEVFSVDGDGTMRRCHFIRDAIGNLYRDDWRSALRPAPCTNDTCGCHIGYVHMPELKLYDVFGDGVLERVPATRIWGGSAIPDRPATPAPRTVPLAQVSASGR
jgi:hypothetical protein